ncbi:hypothetical protein [Fusobacterium phage Fnu1]|uniref:Uncharacterized protein n=1 Tax=Fusobacterium phage Fnu1 TaxID=2530024 RepID=A0A481W6C8_9CAUD|nr:hypothetical protein KMD24_gp054 [Fusobacterium phage Fnu1]QBJ04210.1 hypothetical protein [Fusobacterium phage Fnu1]
MEIIISAIVFIIVIGVWVLNIITPITFILWFLNLLGIFTVNRIGTILLIEIGLWFIFFLIMFYAGMKGWLPKKK